MKKVQKKPQKKVKAKAQANRSIPPRTAAVATAGACMATVQLLADLHGGEDSVMIGARPNHTCHGVVLLNGLQPAFAAIAKLASLAGVIEAYPCAETADLRALANRFVAKHLGDTWSTAESIPSCPQTGGGYRPRRPGDPPCETFRLVEGAAGPSVTLDCGGQPDPRPTRRGARVVRPPLTRQLTLGFSVNVRVTRVE